MTGDIPIKIDALPNLQILVMSINIFSGPVPSKIGNLTMLQILDLDNNTLNGKILFHALTKNNIYAKKDPHFNFFY